MLTPCGNRYSLQQLIFGWDFCCSWRSLPSHISSKIYVSFHLLFACQNKSVRAWVKGVLNLTSVRLCACSSKSALRLSACLTWKELLWLWRTNTISRRSGGTQRTEMWDLTYCETGSWQSMTFWEQDKIRPTDGITELIFANLHYWPGDNNQHIKSLIGLGREYVNVTAQTVLLTKRLAVRKVFVWGNVRPERLTQPSCPLLAERHNCIVSKTQYCYCILRPRLIGSH